MKTKLSFATMAAGALLLSATSYSSAAVIFDDFNVDEGHFNLAPSFSGSNANVAATSTADRVTVDPFEGAGAEQIVLNATTVGSAQRLRFLSGGGSPANNTPFTTSAAGTDGFIGLYVKTTQSGLTVQIALDGPLPDLQGTVPMNVIADGQWNLYEWNLDDPSMFGAVAGIGGNATFEEGVQTIDSVLFRSTAATATATIFMDFVAQNEAGSIALLVPEPGSLALLGLAIPAMLRRRRI